MGRKPFPRNERCPCGSGEKYKRCCFTKGFHYYVVEASGEVFRSLPVSSEARSVLEPALAKQREKFISKFGREPGPDDRIFFDLDEDALHESTVQAMRAAGIRPALIYAHERTGLIVTSQNRHLISATDLDEWEDAVAEYYELYPAEDPHVD